MSLRAAAALFVLAFSACPTPPGPPDAEVLDAGTIEDAGTPDAGRAAPQLQLDSPLEGAELEGLVVPIGGTISAAAGLRSLDYRLDGASPIVIVPSGGAFSLQLPLALGAHELIVTAVDEAGEVSTVTRTFSVVDRSPPALTLVPSAAATRVYDVVLRGAVSDERALHSLTFFYADAGQPVSAEADGGFVVRFAPFPGSSTFELIASDGPNQQRLSGTIFYGRRIAAGASHSLFTLDGNLLTWGRNNQGQLGLDAGAMSDVALAVGLSDVVSVSAGNNTSVALTSAGTVYTFGANGNGQLGLGRLSDGGLDLAHRSAPFQVPGASNIVSIAAGYQHVLLLRADGLVLAFGDNTSGQLARTDAGFSSEADLVPGLADVIQVIGGSQHSAALKRDGTVWTWGRNQYGNLGLGLANDGGVQKDTLPHPTPAAVPGLSGVVQLASGRDHLVALRNDGTVWAWGLGGAAQLGQGSAALDDSSLPLQVQPLTEVVEVAANGNLTFVVRRDGTVWAWGQGAQGALGVGRDPDGGIANKSVPMQVKTVANVTDLAAGALHGFAIQADQSVWGWGWNLNGTLGGGPALQSSWAYTEAIEVVLP